MALEVPFRTPLATLVALSGECPGRLAVVCKLAENAISRKCHATSSCHVFSMWIVAAHCRCKRIVSRALTKLCLLEMSAMQVMLEAAVYSL